MTQKELDGAIEVSSGAKVWPLEPDKDDIHIGDIAHSLAMSCRFNGHTSQFYSVAQHCIHLTSLVPIDYKASALLHDAAEAYLSDIPRPTKRQLDGIEGIERQWLREMQEKWDVQLDPLPDIVKEMDRRLCATEAAHLMHSGGEWWPNRPEAADISPSHFKDTMDPFTARDEFLRVFDLLAKDFYIDING